MPLAEAFERLALAIREDIFKLCTLLNFKPTWQQHEVLQAVQDGYDQVVVRSGQGAGKTTVDVVVATHRMLLGPGAMVVLTAPSMRQCQDVFMAEAKRMFQNADPVLRKIFSFTMRKIFVGKKGRDEGNEPHWGLMAVTATDPVNAQGYHNEYLTAIVDEASGVERPFTEQLMGTLAQNKNALLLMSGNPNSVDNDMYDAFHKNRAEWSCHTFNCEESPIVDQVKVERLKRLWGYESNAYRVRVRGLFPKKDPDCVMSMEDLEECTKVDLGEAVTWSDRKQQGLDFARFGSDESVISVVQGNALLFQENYAQKEPADVVVRAFGIQNEMLWRNEDCLYVGDADGLGNAIMFIFHQAEKQIIEFHTNGKPNDGRTFANRMTEAWFELAALVREKRVYLPNDPELLAQLANRKYKFRLGDGALILESKDDYKKRTEKPSPDKADSCVMAFWSQARVSVFGID